MEYLQKHWYIVLGALVLLFLFARRSSSSMTQIGGGVDVAQLAQISAAERDADENRRYSAVQNFLNYDLALRSLNSQDALSRIGLSQQIDLAQISANAQAQAMANQLAIQSLNSQTALQQYQMQANLQNSQFQNAYNAQTRNDWISAIMAGTQTFLPYLFGNVTNGGGGMNTNSNNVPLFGGSNGGWIFN